MSLAARYFYFIMHKRNNNNGGDDGVGNGKKHCHRPMTDAERFISYCHDHLFLFALSSGETLYHGSKGQISGGYPDGPAWFSPDLVHSESYGAGSLMEYGTTQVLKLVDLRWTAYNYEDSSLFENKRDEEEEGELLPDEESFEVLSTVNEQFGIDRDDDFTLAYRMRDWKVPFDGYVSFDYGYATEVMLFEPAKVLSLRREHDREKVVVSFRGSAPPASVHSASA